MVAKNLVTFEVEMESSSNPDAPWWYTVEATDFGDAENRVRLFDTRKVRSVRAREHVTIISHFDYIEKQDREMAIEHGLLTNGSGKDEERPF